MRKRKGRVWKVLVKVRIWGHCADVVVALCFGCGDVYSVMNGVCGHAHGSVTAQSGILNVEVGHGGSSIIALHEEFVFQHRNVSPFCTSNLHFPRRTQQHCEYTISTVRCTNIVSPSHVLSQCQTV